MQIILGEREFKLVEMKHILSSKESGEGDDKSA
jgi:hypothetical protein